MTEKKIQRSFGTHDGSFHADEVTACALLVLFNLIDKEHIIRTRDRSRLEKCEYVCDVGGIYDPSRKLFDHHQAEYRGDFSSAGMILLYLKEQGIIQEKEYQMFKDVLVLGVDAHDNGKDPQIPGYCTYSHIIANFRPILHDPPPKEEDDAFFEALQFALHHLERLRDRYQYIQSCRFIVEESMKKKSQCLIFEKGIPWQELFFELDGINHPAKFVIMPSGEHWTLRGIPPTYKDRMNVRLPLPAEWAGLLEGELRKITGIEGAVFCHKGRFISVWETKEDAIKALNYILHKNEGEK
jgi:uncharacterized UPF0160 family protein